MTYERFPASGLFPVASNLVRLLRQEAAMSRSQLADLAGLDVHTVRDVELGRTKRGCRGSTVQALARALGVEPYDLLRKAVV